MKILGLIILALPFVAFFIFVTKSNGVLVALKVFGLTAAIASVVAVGTFLAMDGNAADLEFARNAIAEYFLTF